MPGSDAEIQSVRFSIDGKFYTNETSAPFDLLNTRNNGDALMFSTRLLRDGTHTVTARIVLANGSIENQQATFVTLNPRPPTRYFDVQHQQQQKPCPTAQRRNADLAGRRVRAR